MSARFVTVACAVVVLTAPVCSAQSSKPEEGWLNQNYHFTGPPEPGEIRPTDPVISQLQEIQNTTMAILRKANFAGDYEAALAAAAQAAANAQLIGSISERLETMKPRNTSAADPKSEPRLYLVAFRDQSIRAATAYWADAHMLHFLTPQGAHEQVRLDLVDLGFTKELNDRPRPESGKPERLLRTSDH